MGYENLQKELERCLGGEPIYKKFSVLVKKMVTEQNELSRILASDVARALLDGMETKDAARYATTNYIWLYII